MNIQEFHGEIGNDKHQTMSINGNIDPEKIIWINGKNNEQLLFNVSPYGRYNREEWISFFNDISSNGIEHPILIVVEKKCQVTIYEGNHRLRAAVQAGVSIPFEIRVYGHSHNEKLFKSIGLNIN